MAEPEKPPTPVSLWTVFGVSLAGGLAAAGIVALVRIAVARRDAQPLQLDAAVVEDDRGEWSWVR